jgi:hypothetical protein
VALRLAPQQEQALSSLDRELRMAAEAIGAGLGAQLSHLRPGLSRRDEGEPDGLLAELELDREGEPDALSLASCLAAHRAYVSARGEPGGVSVGALALARLLVWASRATLIGPAPRIAWIGPPARRPDPAPGQFELGARCVAEVDGVRREARAVALVSR